MLHTPQRSARFEMFRGPSTEVPVPTISSGTGTLRSVGRPRTVQPLPLSRRRGPRGNWVWGNLAELSKDMLGFFTRCAEEYGDIVPMRFGDRRVALVSHPAAIEQVLVTENRRFTKHFAVQLLRPILGNGLLNNEGQSWLRQRRLCQPAFRRDRLMDHAGSMVTLTQQLTDEWEREPTRDLHDDMLRLTLAIAMKTLMGLDAGDEAGVVREVNEVIMRDFTRRFQSVFRAPHWLPTPHNLQMRSAVLRLNEVIHSMIARRRVSQPTQQDLLSMLVRARDEDTGQGMSDRQLRDEIMTMFLAGHETTAVALTWTWSLLGQHPRVQEQLSEELRLVLQGRPPTAADVPRLKYCDAVIRESMRLFPPGYLIGRKATDRVVIGDVIIPRGTNVLMSPWVVHRDPRWFTAPAKFRPERWADGFASRIPKFAYFPFGGGPRACIGNQFAMLEMVLVLATLAQQFSVELEPSQFVVPHPAVTLRPRAGLPGQVSRRID